jgi:hypothetical protein
MKLCKHLRGIPGKLGELEHALYGVWQARGLRALASMSDLLSVTHT